MSSADINSKVWKTGQRVPFDGHYMDQHKVISFHAAHRTFPPCIGKKGECAYRTLITPASD